jgi:hypothetical protein
MLKILFALLLLAPAGGDDAAAVKQRLIGNWMLVKYEVFGADGGVRPGNFDVGRLIYDQSGEMTGHLTRTDRGAYLGYFGPYTIDAAKGIVIHHVLGSSRADWVGTEQVRYYAFTPAGRLTLSLKQGDRVTQTLT